MLIPKVLVVYYSRTRRTERAANAICNSLEIRGLRCDVEPLREHDDRRGPLGYLRSALDTTFGRPAQLLPMTHKLEDYDVVVVGTPIWFGTMSTPIRSFLASNAARLKNVALYLTCHGSPPQSVLTRMEELAGQPAVAQLAIRDRELATGVYKTVLAPFAERVEEIARRSIATCVRAKAPLSALLH